VKAKQLFISLILGLGLTLALLCLLGGSTLSAHAESPHYVAHDCTGVPVPCHTSIQEAVDAAVPGDEILVAAGTYTGVNVRPRDDITTTGVVT
jgi:pectin methylesterase-like acyl-CoA thioesterase